MMNPIMGIIKTYPIRIKNVNPGRINADQSQDSFPLRRSEDKIRMTERISNPQLIHFG